MTAVSSNRRSESGAQLLARLSTRPDVTSVDPFLFSKLTSSSAQVIELYGTEGSGKTELALCCVAKVCLPRSWNGIQLSGLQAKVIYIDTEAKFSSLRLAVVLEKLVLETLNSKSLCEFKKEQSENSEDNQNIVIKSENTGHDQLIHKDLSKADLNITPQGNTLSQQKCQTDLKLKACYGETSNKYTSPDTYQKCLQQSFSCKSYTPNNSHSVNVDMTNKDISSNSHDYRNVLSPQDIEEIVQDSLGRVLVSRPNSSQQLLATLLSMETSLSEDPSYALLIIDSISAYYWADRVTSPTSYQLLDSRIVPVAKVLKRFSLEIGVTCLITKFAYFSRKKLSEQVLTAAFGEKQSELDTYNEYLGKIWSSINVKRIILTSIIEELKTDHMSISGEKMNDVVKKIFAYCMSSESTKCYMFKDDLLLPLPFQDEFNTKSKTGHRQ